MICADIFGIQNGTVFQEGIVDSGGEEEFLSRLQSLKTAWAEKIGEKGQLFYQWFMKYEAQNMAKCMLRPVRIRAGLGNPPPPFVTNRVECVNSLLKLETQRKMNVAEFANKAQELAEKQRKNVSWSVIVT